MRKKSHFSTLAKGDKVHSETYLAIVQYNVQTVEHLRYKIVSFFPVKNLQEAQKKAYI